MLTVVMQSEPPTRSHQTQVVFFNSNLHDRPSQLQRVLQLLTGEREMESEDLPVLRTEKVHDVTYQFKLKIYGGLELDRLFIIQKSI